MPTSSAPREHLKLEGIGVSFGAVNVIPSLDLSVRKGEMVAFLGPSGCGKTTTLRIIAGLNNPSRGRIMVGGRDITRLPIHDRDMGMVFQSYALFPHMNVSKNVQFGLQMRGMPAREAEKRAAEALEMVQLGHLAHRKPKELSGGQQQRVALARALVVEPSILLLDEPLSNLDAKLRDEMRVQIRTLQQQSGITAVFVTHDQVEALSMCDRVVVMRNGHIEQFGTPTEVYERPATAFVANFVGRTNRLKGMITAEGTLAAAGQQLHSAAKLAPGSVEVLVRPHRIHLQEANGTDNKVQGSVSNITFVGDLVQYGVRVGDEEFVVEEATRRGRNALAAGDRVTLNWSAEDTLVYPVGGQ
ncbi:ABC transporter ATP-binding protein [Ensifer adhaerens]|uniref:ABC transporter ATP-binding protein n=1 Tax=Ensifer adhaerens TaxID=106592 RepID=UPI001CBFC253|nr:ABC transporter ATP-binding protein [Ensifer adhaerens]MBZ7924268.1 ABC transporter ATP-binding protein [Ensifer adhaerens]UAX96479.1 ABC transporter ATP-binding protein [Ensifer adhaerens]UAY04178.1 ABC transporter ATP-binding protein [Ensifer adhaerens]UAY12164.1 ABC transporter ATP-binding protein [Ensifer adhaerens]